MKVAVIGANGQLGQDVVRAFADRGDDVQALNHEDVELSSLDSVVSGFALCAARGCSQHRRHASCRKLRAAA